MGVEAQASEAGPTSAPRPPASPRPLPCLPGVPIARAPARPPSPRPTSAAAPTPTPTPATHAVRTQIHGLQEMPKPGAGERDCAGLQAGRSRGRTAGTREVGRAEPASQRSRGGRGAGLGAEPASRRGRPAESPSGPSTGGSVSLLQSGVGAFPTEGPAGGVGEAGMTPLEGPPLCPGFLGGAGVVTGHASGDWWGAASGAVVGDHRVCAGESRSLQSPDPASHASPPPVPPAQDGLRSRLRPSRPAAPSAAGGWGGCSSHRAGRT